MFQDFFIWVSQGCRINIFTSQGEVGEQGYTGPQGPPGSKVRGSFLQHIYRILTPRSLTSEITCEGSV